MGERLSERRGVSRKEGGKLSEAFGKFEEACVRPQFNEMLQRMEQAFQQEKKQFRSQFILDFQ